MMICSDNPVFFFSFFSVLKQSRTVKFSGIQVSHAYMKSNEYGMDHIS